MKKKLQKHILEQKLTGVPVYTTAHVTEQKKDIVRVLMMGLLSFLMTVFIVFFISKFFPLLKNTKKNVVDHMPKLTSLSSIAPFSQVIKTVSSLLPKSHYDYYQTKREFIDPVLIKEVLDKKDSNTLIVDIRSVQEYKSAHIKTAINAPAYTNSQDVYGSLTPKNDIRTEIEKKIKGKRLIVVYGYKPDSDISQDVYENLKQIVPVRMLGVSWNDWKNNFYAWLPNAEKQSFVINTYLEGIDVTNGIGLPQL